MQTGNQAGYSRHRDVSRKTVTEWKQRGLLRFTADGEVDFRASDQALRDHGLLDSEQAAVPDGMWSMAEAETVKENYAARIKRLEFERESAAVAEIDDVAAAIISEYAMVRQRLSRIGADMAPRLAGVRDASLIKAAIDAEVVAALPRPVLVRVGKAARAAPERRLRPVREFLPGPKISHGG